jgi:hypothetical protein
MGKDYEIGAQYPEDKHLDASGFLAAARLHQSKFRAEVLRLPCAKYGNYLTKDDALQGKNFYQDQEFGVFKAVQDYNKNYNDGLYANMLRSEHIPFNFFIPLEKNKEYFAKILNEFFGDNIKAVDLLQIEYAPQPPEDYLNDRTSFDVYLEYTHKDSRKGILGVEVKYTEREYHVSDSSKEYQDVNNPESSYYRITKECGLFKDEAIGKLKEDDFRQIWRNQLLGESILLKDKDTYSYFTSITIYQKGNRHFAGMSAEYPGLLKDAKGKALFITYEDFIGACEKHCPDDRYRAWANYLKQRYIIQ